MNNMSQSRLAELVGIARSAVTQYLSGDFVPRQETLTKISDVLNVEEAWLRGYDLKQVTPNSPEAIEIFKSKRERLGIPLQRVADVTEIAIIVLEDWEAGFGRISNSEFRDINSAISHLEKLGAKKAKAAVVTFEKTKNSTEMNSEEKKLVLPRKRIGVPQIILLDDSMKQFGFLEGDIVEIALGKNLASGDFGVFKLGDNKAVRKYICDANTNLVVLEPGNPKFQKTIFEEGEYSKIIGKVVGLQRRFK